MGDPYYGSPAAGASDPYYGPHATRAGSPYYGGAKPAAPAAKKSGWGVGGFLGHLGSDVASTAVGIGPGLYHAGKAVFEANHGNSKPLKQLAQQTAADYEATYGHGLGHFGHAFYEHPLGPLLDALTVASAGAGAAAKVGKVAAEAGAISKTSRLARLGDRATTELRSPAARAGQKGPVRGTLTSERPLVKARKVISNRLLNKISFTRGAHSVDVESYRYGKAIRREALQGFYQELPHYRAYTQATKNLSDREWAALNIIPRDVHPHDLAEFWQGSDLERLVRDPKVVALVERPTPRLRAAVAAARELSAQGERLFKQQKLLSESAAKAKPEQFRNVVSETLGRPVKPLHGDPFYVPDVAAPVKGSTPYAAVGGGKGVPQAPGSARLNKGVLARLGKLDVKRDVLGPEFLRRGKLTMHSLVHDSLLEAAVKRTPAEAAAGLPAGWDYVRAPVISKATGRARSQRITYTKQIDTGRAALPQDLSQLIPNPDDLSSSSLSEGFGARGDRNLAYFDGQHYFIAPKTLINSAAGEFHRSSKAVRMFVEKPLSVWRYLILGTRPAFLVNNVVGNHIMLATKTAGPDGLRAYLHALYNARGPGPVKSLLNLPETPNGIRQRFMAEFFPEQGEGTFGRTQGPGSVLVPGKLARKTKALGTGIFPATQAVAENLPRRAATEAFIRMSPEYKTLYRSLPAQTRTFEQTARQLLSGEGGKLYQRRISEQVNETLGNYLNLGPAGRALRNVLPFWSWYRAIATVTWHLAADTPGRALALQRLGQIGSEDTQRALGALPSYLRGVIPIGKPSGGEQTIVSTAGMNPYATLEQVGRGGTTDISGLGLSPFILGPATAYKYGKTSPGAIARETLTQTLLGLPTARLAHPLPPSNLYPHRSRLTEALSQAGLPIKRVRLSEAHKRAAKGQ